MNKMSFLDKRINVICTELKNLSVKQSFPIDNWQYKAGYYLHPADAEKGCEPFEKFDSKTMHWYGPDRHYWFRTDVIVPESMEGKTLWFHVNVTENAPQFLLLVNGMVTQGIDINHSDVLLEQCAKSGAKYRLELQAYSGSEDNEYRLVADLREVDKEIYGLYYDMIVPLWAFSRLDEDGKPRREIEYVLNEAVNLLDLRVPYSDAFYNSMAKCRQYLAKALYTDLACENEVIASCIGHTHIDVGWRWTVNQTKEKVCRSFATVLKLMDEYPNYKFMSSQPQLYAFLKQRYPELFEQIKERVAEGRWEPEGGMWVEADCNLTSGESLVRQFLYGKEFFKDEFGVNNRVLWLPDVFGYSGALPQIMKKCGIDYFMTTKLAWNQFNKMPYDTFMWRGIDGTQILTYLVTTLDVGQDEDNYFTTYNGMLHPDAIIGGWHRYQQKNINNDILVCYGYGDGGGGPTREMLETSSRMEKGICGIPKVRQSFVHNFFDELDKRVREDRRLPVWEGELYFEYHRGTLTSMARNKRSNRKAEFHMMDLELLGVMALPVIDYPSKEIDNMWHVILTNQFHDILPGSAIHEVYEVTKKEYEQLESEIKSLQDERLSAITPNGDGVTVYNTTGFERNDIVEIEGCKSDALVDSDGNVFKAQKTESGAIVYLKGIPSKGRKTFAYSKNEGDSNKLIIGTDEHSIETPFYNVHIDKQGNISSIFDRKNNREVIKYGEKANLMRVFEDKPAKYDNWDIDIYYTEKFWNVEDLQVFEWIEKGPVRATLHIKYLYSNSEISQYISFYSDIPRIDFNTKVDWHEHQHLLKVEFPCNVHTDEATFDIQFGNLTRKTHTNTSWDKARFESCGQKWIDLSEGHYGVSLLNDCKYGHSIKDGCISLTLIKSGIEPNPVADQEVHYFTYSLYPHVGNWRDAATVKEAYFLNQPAIVVEGGVLGDMFSLASCDAPNVVIETIKQAQDGNGAIVRLYESENALTQTVLHWGRNITNAISCDLLEHPDDDSLTIKNDAIYFTIKPYEVKTFRIF